MASPCAQRCAFGVEACLQPTSLRSCRERRSTNSMVLKGCATFEPYDMKGVSIVPLCSHYRDRVAMLLLDNKAVFSLPVGFTLCATVTSVDYT